ncbi:hypothetical protein ACW9HQ_48720, partial [Nocardia gipuzkoensis]
MTVGRIARVLVVAGIVAGCGSLGSFAAQAQPNGACPRCAIDGPDNGTPLAIPGRTGSAQTPAAHDPASVAGQTGSAQSTPAAAGFAGLAAIL